MQAKVKLLRLSNVLAFGLIPMNLKIFTVGSLLTNCYVAWCSRTREAIVIDPGFDRREESDEVLNFLRENSLKVRFIVDTHGHPDHICGNGVIKSETGAPILIHKSDANLLDTSGRWMGAMFDFRAASPVHNDFLKDGDVVKFGDVVLQVLHTPGHSPGSVSLIGAKCVFTGDTLFAGSIGRVDLTGGSAKEIMRSLKEKLAGLPDSFIVYPGHGPTSTIGEEKRTNPFLQKDFDISLLG